LPATFDFAGAGLKLHATTRKFDFADRDRTPPLTVAYFQRNACFKSRNASYVDDLIFAQRPLPRPHHVRCREPGCPQDPDQHPTSLAPLHAHRHNIPTKSYHVKSAGTSPFLVDFLWIVAQSMSVVAPIAMFVTSLRRVYQSIATRSSNVFGRPFRLRYVSITRSQNRIYRQFSHQRLARTQPIPRPRPAYNWL
jgi:hypothetical protein